MPGEPRTTAYSVRGSLLNRSLARRRGSADRLEAVEEFLRARDLATDLGHLAVLAARHLAHAAEGVLLVDAQALHQDALGAFDELAVLHRLTQRRGLLTGGAHLAVA